MAMASPRGSLRRGEHGSSGLARRDDGHIRDERKSRAVWPLGDALRGERRRLLVEREEDVVEDGNVARAGAWVDVNLATHLEVSWRAGVGEAPDLVAPRSGTKTSPLNSRDMWGLEGAPSGTGNGTAGESVWKRSGSPGTVATKEQLGDPNYHWFGKTQDGSGTKEQTHVDCSYLAGGEYAREGRAVAARRDGISERQCALRINLEGLEAPAGEFSLTALDRKQYWLIYYSDKQRRLTIDLGGRNKFKGFFWDEARLHSHDVPTAESTDIRPHSQLQACLIYVDSAKYSYVAVYTLATHSLPAELPLRLHSLQSRVFLPLYISKAKYSSGLTLQTSQSLPTMVYTHLQTLGKPCLTHSAELAYAYSAEHLV
ncbi:hypothetical protein IMY05_C4466000900 [Salix suchowensis]|nr:hypothetical protein IMY05_C4466000900 [Salix suchowensis]